MKNPAARRYYLQATLEMGWSRNVLIHQIQSQAYERHRLANGIILCAERDYFEVEYALRGLDQPVGVSEYLLTRELPPELQNKLPNAKQLEDEIRKGISVSNLSDKIK